MVRFNLDVRSTSCSDLVICACVTSKERDSLPFVGENDWSIGEEIALTAEFLKDDASIFLLKETQPAMHQPAPKVRSQVCRFSFGHTLPMQQNWWVVGKNENGTPFIWRCAPHRAARLFNRAWQRPASCFHPRPPRRSQTGYDGAEHKPVATRRPCKRGMKTISHCYVPSIGTMRFTAAA